jgi:hypothetical protein
MVGAVDALVDWGDADGGGVGFCKSGISVGAWGPLIEVDPQTRGRKSCS